MHKNTWNLIAAINSYRLKNAVFSSTLQTEEVKGIFVNRIQTFVSCLVLALYASSYDASCASSWRKGQKRDILWADWIYESSRWQENQPHHQFLQEEAAPAGRNQHAFPPGWQSLPVVVRGHKIHFPFGDHLALQVLWNSFWSLARILECSWLNHVGRSAGVVYEMGLCISIRTEGTFTPMLVR